MWTGHARGSRSCHVCRCCARRIAPDIGRRRRWRRRREGMPSTVGITADAGAGGGGGDGTTIRRSDGARGRGGYHMRRRYRFSARDGASPAVRNSWGRDVLTATMRTAARDGPRDTAAVAGWLDGWMEMGAVGAAAAGGRPAAWRRGQDASGHEPSAGSRRRRRAARVQWRCADAGATCARGSRGVGSAGAGGAPLTPKISSITERAISYSAPRISAGRPARTRPSRRGSTTHRPGQSGTRQRTRATA